MAHRTIPILPAPSTRWRQPAAEGCAPCAPRLLGDTPRARRVLAALEHAVHGHVPRPDWLIELRVDDDEASAALAPTLAGEQGLWLAQTTFDTLRRLLPDTDIYVGCARH